MQVTQALKDNYLFRGLTEDQFDAVMALTQEKSFDGGETLVRQFGRDTDLLVVLSGAALIKTFSGDAIVEVGPGSVIGEISLIDDEPRSATVTCKGTTSVAVIPSEAIKNMMKHDRDLRCTLMENIAKVLCRRLRSANVQLDSAMASQAEAVR